MAWPASVSGGSILPEKRFSRLAGVWPWRTRYRFMVGSPWPRGEQHHGRPHGERAEDDLPQQAQHGEPVEAAEGPAARVLAGDLVDLVAQLVAQPPDLRGEREARVQRQPQHPRHQPQLERQRARRTYRSRHDQEGGQQQGDGTRDEDGGVEPPEDLPDDFPGQAPGAGLVEDRRRDDEADGRAAPHPQGQREEKDVVHQERRHAVNGSSRGGARIARGTEEESPCVPLPSVWPCCSPRSPSRPARMPRRRTATKWQRPNRRSAWMARRSTSSWRSAARAASSPCPSSWARPAASSAPNAAHPARPSPTTSWSSPPSSRAITASSSSWTWPSPPGRAPRRCRWITARSARWSWGPAR